MLWYPIYALSALMYMIPACLYMSPWSISLQYLPPFLFPMSRMTSLLLSLLLTLCIPLWSFLCMCLLFSFFPLVTSASLSLLSMSSASLCCRPVWISGNRSAFSECYQEWLSSNWRYCSSDVFHCHTTIIINHEIETVCEASRDDVMYKRLVKIQFKTCAPTRSF